MNIGYLLVLAIIAAVCLYFSRGRKDNGNSRLKEISMSPSERIIHVFDIDKNQLEKALDSDTTEQEITSIKPEGNGFRITFIPTMGYLDFCFWVNYLVYSDEEKQKRYKVYGWYPFGEVEINGEKQPFSNQTVMMYVDKDDTEYDNISFVTPDGNHYLQFFDNGNNLKPLDSGSEKYTTIQ